MAERRPIAARVGPAADQFITDIAAQTQVSRATVMRAMLAIAANERTAVIAKINQIKSMP